MAKLFTSFDDEESLLGWLNYLLVLMMKSFIQRVKEIINNASLIFFEQYTSLHIITR